jgi:pyruvate/2-oxoglutarate dehydrogenase complex dihydrolipoamide dehydrogenase (E3) component
MSCLALLKNSRVYYGVASWAAFTDPEVARVGLNKKMQRHKKFLIKMLAIALMI